MTRGPRRLAAALGGWLLAAAVSIMAWENLRGPQWSRYWSNCPPGGVPAAAGLNLAELGRLVLPAKNGRSGREIPRGDALPSWGRMRPEFFPGLYGQIRAEEQRGYREALEAYRAYLEEIAARRLNAERLRWEELYRDRALQLAEEGETRLQAYAGEIRAEYYGAISSLEMRISLAESREAAEELEAKLAATKAEIEARIAQRREDLARECALQLGVLQAQSRDALIKLEAELAEENRRALAAFVRTEEERYREWLARNRQAETGLKGAD